MQGWTLIEPTQSDNAKTIIVHGPRPILCHIKISRYLNSNVPHSQLVSLHSIGHTLLNLGLKLTQSLCTQRLYRPDLYNVVMCMHRHYYFGYTIDTLLLQESAHVHQHYLHCMSQEQFSQWFEMVSDTDISNSQTTPLLGNHFVGMVYILQLPKT